MEWKQDGEVQDFLREYLVNQRDDLGNLLNALSKHNDGSTPFQFLKVWGMFVWRYTSYLEENTETDALELTIASIMHDPTVQNMVGSMVKSQIDRGLNLE